MKCPPNGVNGPLTAPRPPVAEAWHYKGLAGWLGRAKGRKERHVIRNLVLLSVYFRPTRAERQGHRGRIRDAHAGPVRAIPGLPRANFPNEMEG
jgi:hypothetical protein